MKKIKSADDLLIEEFATNASQDVQRRIAAGTFDDYAAEQSRKILHIVELAKLGNYYLFMNPNINKIDEGKS